MEKAKGEIEDAGRGAGGLAGGPVPVRLQDSAPQTARTLSISASVATSSASNWL